MGVFLFCVKGLHRNLGLFWDKLSWCFNFLSTTIGNNYFIYFGSSTNALQVLPTWPGECQGGCDPKSCHHTNKEAFFYSFDSRMYSASFTKETQTNTTPCLRWHDRCQYIVRKCMNNLSLSIKVSWISCPWMFFFFSCIWPN